jgi:hypothetical protein
MAGRFEKALYIGLVTQTLNDVNGNQLEVKIEAGGGLVGVFSDLCGCWRSFIFKVRLSTSGVENVLLIICNQNGHHFFETGLAFRL